MNEFAVAVRATELSDARGADLRSACERGPSGVRRFTALLALVVSSATGLLGVGAGAAVADSCPNAALRAGASASLSDCRAYEMVSPVDKNNFDIHFGTNAVAIGGNAVTYNSLGAFAGAPASAALDQYLSRRSAEAWSTDPVTLPAADSSDKVTFGPLAFSDDLSEMIIQNGNPPLDGATPDTINLYRRDPNGALHLLTPGQPVQTDPGSLPAPNTLVDTTADFSRVLFAEARPVLPGDPQNVVNLYESVNGVVHLVNVLPDGTPDTQGVAQRGATNQVSQDGSRIFWTDLISPEGLGGVYLREDDTSSVLISASQRSTADPDCTPGHNCTSGSDAQFATASTDGLVAYFVSPEKLTDDSTACVTCGSGAGSELYRYDVGTGELTDLTVDAADSTGGDVQGLVGSSDDGSTIYFVANGVLAPGATAGDCIGEFGGNSCNLYVWHAGTTRFVATLTTQPDPANGISDSANWNPELPLSAKTIHAQVAADGAHLLFTTRAVQPGFDNAGHSEVYLYDRGGSGTLTCVSCAPGVTPTGASAPTDPNTLPVNAGSAPNAAYRNMSSDASRAFFMSPDPLVSQDTNGTYDVYEWQDGQLHLLSSGHSDGPSTFIGSTPSGDDALFLTREKLVGQDVDDNVDVYDARVGGGLSRQNPPDAPAMCVSDDCRGNPSAPPGTSPLGSVSFVGPGNVVNPRATFKVSAITPAARRRFARTGTLALTVKVSAAGTIAGRAKARIGKHTRTVASRLVRKTKAGTLHVRLSLSKAARRQLSRAHRLKVAITVKYSQVPDAKHATLNLHR